MAKEVKHSLLLVEQELKKLMLHIKNNERQIAQDQALSLKKNAAALAEKQLPLYERAIELYQKTIDLTPDEPGTLKNYGELLAHLDRYEQALIPLKKALRLNPVDFDTQIFIMRLELSLGRPEALMVG